MGELSLGLAEKEVAGWSEIVQDPLWYLKLVPVIQDWYDQFPSLSDQERESIKNVMYGFFEGKLENGGIFLGKGDGEGENFDQFRQPISMAVVHHTSQTPVTWQRLSAMALIRQYAVNWYEHDDFKGIKTRDKPIWSNHFRDGKQVFYDYHWLVRKDGSFERLLVDQNVGFHAKEVNPYSVGIAIDDRLWRSSPTIESIEAIVTIIRFNYPRLTRDQVVGHGEVTKNDCPGNQFLSGWKDQILERLI